MSDKTPTRWTNFWRFDFDAAKVSALKAARERGLRGKAFLDFAESIGLSRYFKMIRRDHPDRGIGAKEG